jgi:hypothetical protein
LAPRLQRHEGSVEEDHPYNKGTDSQL